MDAETKKELSKSPRRGHSSLGRRSHGKDEVTSLNFSGKTCFTNVSPAALLSCKSLHGKYQSMNFPLSINSSDSIIRSKEKISDRNSEYDFTNDLLKEKNNDVFMSRREGLKEIKTSDRIFTRGVEFDIMESSLSVASPIGLSITDVDGDDEKENYPSLPSVRKCCHDKTYNVDFESENNGEVDFEISSCNDSMYISPPSSNSDDNRTPESLYTENISNSPNQHIISDADVSHYYWEMCYGNSNIGGGLNHSGEWSAKRAPPLKSCLSSRKKSKNISPQVTAEEKKMTPPTYKSNAPMLIPATDELKIDSSKNVEAKNDTTPNSIELASSSFSVKGTNISWQKNVKFGSASAAEFDSERPALEITPMSKAAAEERYKLEEKVEDEDTKEMGEVTKMNNAALSDWEENFDLFLNSSDEESDEEKENRGKQAKRRGRRNKKSSERKKKRSINRSGRRSSTIFSPGGRSLISPIVDETFKVVDDPPYNKQKCSDTSPTLEGSEVTTPEKISEPSDVEISEVPQDDMQRSYIDSISENFQSPVSKDVDNHRRMSALFQNMNRSGALMTSPVDEYETITDEPKGEKICVGAKSIQRMPTPNQLDLVLKKFENKEQNFEEYSTEPMARLVADPFYEFSSNMAQIFFEMGNNDYWSSFGKENKVNEFGMIDISRKKTSFDHIVHVLNGQTLCSSLLNPKESTTKVINDMFSLCRWEDIPLLHNEVKYVVSEAISHANRYSAVDIDRSKREFEKYIHNEMNSEYVQEILLDLFTDTILISVSEIDKWEEGQLWKVLEDRLSKHTQLCEHEKSYLATMVDQYALSSDKLNEQVKHEEMLINDLEMEIKDEEEALNSLHLINAAGENQVSQQEYNIVSEILPYSFHSLSDARVELLFPRDDDSFPTEISNRILIRWSKCAPAQNDNKDEEQWTVSIDTLNDLERRGNRFQVLSSHQNSPSGNSTLTSFYYEFFRRWTEKIDGIVSSIAHSSSMIIDTLSKVHITVSDIADLQKDHFCNVFSGSKNESDLELHIVLTDVTFKREREIEKKSESRQQTVKIVLSYHVLESQLNNVFCLHPIMVKVLSDNEWSRDFCAGISSEKILEALFLGKKVQSNVRSVFLLRKLCSIVTNICETCTTDYFWSSDV